MRVFLRTFLRVIPQAAHAISTIDLSVGGGDDIALYYYI